MHTIEKILKNCWVA